MNTTNDDPMKQDESNTPLFTAWKDDVLSLYPNPELYYHSTPHINRMLDDMQAAMPLIITTYPTTWGTGFIEGTNILDLTLMAILFHDIVYKTGSHDNELLSAVYATGYLSRKAVGDMAEYTTIAQLIMSTHKSADMTKATPIQKVLHDLDWIAFSDEALMGHNAPLLYNEATRDGYLPHEIIAGQVTFFESLQGKDIYYSDLFVQHNKQAQKNIYQKLLELNCGCHSLAIGQKRDSNENN